MKSIVGAEHVATEKSFLDSFAASNLVKGKAPVAAVKPQNAGQVQALVRYANQKGVPLVARSSRGPGSRGSTVPFAKGAVMVDLSEMKQIVRVDKHNQVALIEPGVRFGALEQAAVSAGLRVAMPLCPPASQSVTASILEREPTLFPKYHWDMQDPLCCMEVVFGAGHLFRTGSSAGPGSLEDQWASGQAQKSPMGPAQTDWGKIIQGSQGTMGIVTWTSVKLEKLPMVEKGFVVQVPFMEQVLDFTYSIVQRRLPDVCLLLNAANLAALLGKQAGQDLPAWALVYSISGYDHFPQDRVAYLEADINDLARRHGVRPGRSMSGLTSESLVRILNAPSDEPYWKNVPKGSYLDLFFLTTLDKTPEFIGKMEGMAKAKGFSREDLGIYIQPIMQGRACHLEFTLFYNQQDESQKALATSLFHEASGVMMDMGGFFSRPYGPWADLAYARCPDTVAALKKVKNILDPNNVMNPGKLCFK